MRHDRSQLLATLVFVYHAAMEVVVHERNEKV
jgi:hypothetical protein